MPETGAAGKSLFLTTTTERKKYEKRKERVVFMPGLCVMYLFVFFLSIMITP